jgi:hypothetical protein
MNILIPYNKFDPTNIFFLEKRNIIQSRNYSYFDGLKNKDFITNTMEKKAIDGNYTKIIYSTKYFTMNGIYLTFPIVPLCIYKNIITFSEQSSDFLQSIEKIEKDCLDYYSFYFSIEKQPVYYLYQQLKNGNIKYYKETNGSQYYLKISGIWDTDYEYGITYKIITG